MIIIYNRGIYIRLDDDRFDVIRVMITGPLDTPYALGLFMFDMYLPFEYELLGFVIMFIYMDHFVFIVLLTVTRSRLHMCFLPPPARPPAE